MSKELVPFTQMEAVENTFGIDDSLAKTIDIKFKPYVIRMKELEGELKNALKLEKTPENAKDVKTLLQKFVKIRTSLDEEHKVLKSAYRNVGLYIDAWKNAQKAVAEKIEPVLKEFVNYEKIEKEAREHKLAMERMALIQPYLAVGQGLPELGTLEESMWDILFKGTKESYEKRQAEAEAFKKQEAIAREHARRTNLMFLYSEYLSEIELKSFKDCDVETFNKLLKRVAKLKKEADAEEARLAKLTAQAEKVEEADVQDTEPVIDMALENEKFDYLISETEKLARLTNFDHEPYKETYAKMQNFLDQVVVKLKAIKNG